MRRWALGASFVLVILAVALPWFVAIVSSPLAVAMAVHGPGRHAARHLGSPTSSGESGYIDPWGKPILEWPGSRPDRFYSMGPNGRDDCGGGDDVVPSTLDMEIGRRLAAARLGFVPLAAI